MQSIPEEVKLLIFFDLKTIEAEILFFPAILLYFPVIIAFKFAMEKLNKKTKVSLKSYIKPYHEMWNLFLSVFSFYGAYKSLNHFYNNGYGCNFTDEITTIMRLFCLSKVPELLDTVFIILNDKPLVILQYYHHFATLVLSYFGYIVMPSGLIILAMMNFSVHSVMYGYFFLVSIGFKSLRKIGFIITFMQMMQMLIAVILLFILKPESCQEHNVDIPFFHNVTIIMYTSYLILFADLLFNKLKY